MSDMRQLRDIWAGSLAKQMAKLPGSSTGPSAKDYARSIDTVVDLVIKHLLKEVPRVPGRDLDNIRESFQQKRSDLLDGDNRPVWHLKKEYSTLRQRFDHLHDERRQANWATTVDYVKMYLSRTLQAATIALIILGAGYLAKTWEIPLPLLTRVAM